MVPDVVDAGEALRRGREHLFGLDERRGGGEDSVHRVRRHPIRTRTIRSPAPQGVASLDVIEGEDVPAKARKIGAHLRERLTWLGEQYEMVGDIRGRGLLQGIELVEDRRTKAPATRQGSDINRRCLENGLIFSQRRGGSVLRFVPPATTTEGGQMDQAMDILTDAVDKASVRGAVSG